MCGLTPLLRPRSTLRDKFTGWRNDGCFIHVAESLYIKR